MSGRDEFLKRIGRDNTSLLAYKPHILRLFSAYDKIPRDNTILDWCQELTKFNPSTVKDAIDSLINQENEFMPKLPKLIGECKRAAYTPPKQNHKVCDITFVSKIDYWKRFGALDSDRYYSRLKELEEENRRR